MLCGHEALVHKAMGVDLTLEFTGAGLVLGSTAKLSEDCTFLPIC